MPDETPTLATAEAKDSLAVDALYTRCDINDLTFVTTDELEVLSRHLGQERAVDALEFGLAIPHEGYNIFVLGSSGIGKRSLLNSLLDASNAAPQGEVTDWCYVNNFDAPDKPIALQLPPGHAEKLRHDMAQAVEDLLGVFPATFQSDEYQSRVQELGEIYQAREQEAFQGLAEKAKAQQVAMIQTPGGYSLAPMKDNEIISPEDFETLPEDEKNETLELIDALKDELKAIVRQLPGWKKESRSRFRELNREFSKLALDPVLEELKNRYQPYPAVMNYLDSVHANMMEEAETFTQVKDDSAIPDNLKERVKDFPQYNVNVLVDNGELSAAPVVYEDSPGFSNLIGRVEYTSQMGTLVTDFNLIKAGALHRANGGYLILEAEKLLMSPYAWVTLKQALKAAEIRIQSLEQIFSFVSTVQLEPATIPLRTKVVVIGNRYIYYLLQQYDPEFASLFKVAADMSEDVSRNRETTVLFARLVRTLLKENKLLPMDAAAVARTIEHAARSMQDSERLSLHQGRLQDLLTESDFRARRQHLDCITADIVEESIEAAIHRLDQLREKSHEGILRDLMLVATQGQAIGQVNGLAVYLLGEYAFGRPTRISATARLGQGKVLDIEREVDLGGDIHSKAVMIISSLLGNRYARDRPLPLSASLTFEQSYGGVDGDSASVAELAVLISAIADIPLRQDLAITGSLNQHGEVQAIGGVNEKIEGFFDICQARGLTGSQGVIIPASNRVHLMLRRDVREAVRDGDFHVYTVSNVDEALELLTGCTVASIDRHVITRVEQLQSLKQAFIGRGNRDDDS